MKPPAPETLGFVAAPSVRDVGVECSNHSTPTSCKLLILLQDFTIFPNPKQIPKC